VKARLISFGLVEIDGKKYEHDVVIDGGRVRKRRKGPSKAHRDEFGHTPLSVAEEIPWTGRRLIIGTGANGQLPVMDGVYVEARRRGIEVVTQPTAAACELLAGGDDEGLTAILHVTC
jgi:hypothetical protein